MKKLKRKPGTSKGEREALGKERWVPTLQKGCKPLPCLVGGVTRGVRGYKPVV